MKNTQSKNHKEFSLEFEELLNKYRSPLLYNNTNNSNNDIGMSPSPLKKFNVPEEEQDINYNHQRQSFLGLRRKKTFENDEIYTNNSHNLNFFLDSTDKINHSFESKLQNFASNNLDIENNIQSVINNQNDLHSAHDSYSFNNFDDYNKNKAHNILNKFNFSNKNSSVSKDICEVKVDNFKNISHKNSFEIIKNSENKKKTSLIFDKLEAKCSESLLSSPNTNLQFSKHSIESFGNKPTHKFSDLSEESKYSNEKFSSYNDISMSNNLQENNSFGYGYLENFYITKSNEEQTDSEEDKENNEPNDNLNQINTMKKTKSKKKLPFRPNKLLFYAEKPKNSPEKSKTTDKEKDKGKDSKNQCSCKNTQCIKLYCECFRNKKYCIDCGCINCFNLPQYDDVREKAAKYLQKRNKSAFIPKLKETDIGTGVQKQHLKGCKCKNSSCLKNYCECYQLGVTCSDNCGCSDCKNNVFLEGVKAYKRKMNHNLYNSNKKSINN